MKYIVQINNKSYEVEVERGQATLISTTDAAQPAPVAPAAAPAVGAPVAPVAPAATAAPAAPAPAATAPAPVGDGTRIDAPMPGTIVKINCADGQSVKKGELLFVLEAMKMENEILSPVDGSVAQISVASGASVSTGQILALIK